MNVPARRPRRAFRRAGALAPLLLPPRSGILCPRTRSAVGGESPRLREEPGLRVSVFRENDFGADGSPGPGFSQGMAQHGEVAERLKAAVLKTARVKALVGSNPTLSAMPAPRPGPRPGTASRPGWAAYEEAREG